MLDDWISAQRAAETTIEPTIAIAAVPVDLQSHAIIRQQEHGRDLHKDYRMDSNLSQ
jgi:hypothetical protein